MADELKLPERYWDSAAQRWVYPGDVNLPFPAVRCGEYAGPAGEGASEDYYTADQMREAILAERERCAKLCDAERDEHMPEAGRNDGRRSSDFAFGSVNSAERLAAAIRQG